MPFTYDEASAGTLSGKKLTTGSSIDSRPSACAIPIAVDVKLLDNEYRR
jgi:hypothetical protein